MPSLPQLAAILGSITAFITIIVGAYRLGVVGERQNSTERSISAALLDFREQLAKVADQLQDSALARAELAGWRATTDNRLGNIETEAGRFAKNTHELRNMVQAHDSRLAVVEKEGRK